MTEHGPEDSRARWTTPSCRIWPSDTDAGRSDGPTGPPVFDVDDLAVFYGSFKAVREVFLDIHAQRDHGVHRPVGLRQEHGAALLQPDERHRARRAGRGHDHLPRHRPLRPRASRPRRCAAASAWCSRSRTRSRRASTTTSPTGPRLAGIRKRSELDAIVEKSLRGAALWDEVKDRLEDVGPRPVRRPATAPVHRPGDRRRARGDPHGRAVLGARPDRHGSHRGADGRDQDAVHDRDRHPQHAAGGPGQRPHRLLHHRGQSGQRPAHRPARRVRADRRRSSRTPPTSAPRTT